MSEKAKANGREPNNGGPRLLERREALKVGTLGSFGALAAYTSVGKVLVKVAKA